MTKGRGEAAQDNGDGEALAVRAVRLDPDRFPDLSKVQSIELRKMARTRREARYIGIKSRHTGEHHHDSVTIKTLRQKAGTWQEDVKHSVTITDEDGVDEIQRLLEFLLAIRSELIPEGASEYLILGAPAGEGLDVKGLQHALNGLSASARVDLVVDVLEGLSKAPDLLRALYRRAHQNPELFEETAAAVNLARYRNALSELKELIERPNVREYEFQRLRQDNPWMFGSEYSEVLDRRRWTRDEEQDFVVRRTTDRFLELIEIKTPLDGKDLFNKDSSHDSHYAAADLAKVLGQVEKYLERLDADRHAIRATDREDPNKIRAKVIIGRDGDEEQVAALRRFNGHLHRIEIITFDHLLRIAESVVDSLVRVLRPADPRDVQELD